MVLFTNSIYSQTTISGTVKDGKGVTLPGANIYFKGTYEGTSSDNTGHFELKTTLRGKQILLVEFIGFETVERELILDHQELYFDFVLKEIFNKLKAVTITAGTFEAGDKKKSVILSPVDMVTIAGATGDVYGALEMLPGVTSNPESGKLFVKGGSSEESQTYINGMLVHVPYNSSVPNTSTRGRFNPFIFGGTIFSTGGYSAEYGQALSSVLILETKDQPVEDQLNFSLMSVGADAAVTKIWENGGITLTAKYNNMKPYMSLVPQNFNWHHYPESYGSELSFQQKTGNGQIKVYANYGKSKLSLDQANPNNLNDPIKYDLDDENAFVNVSWKEIVSQNTFLKTGLSYTNNANEMSTRTEDFSKNLKGLNLKSILVYQFNPKILIKTGVEYGFQKYELGYQTRETYFSAAYQNIQLSAFSESEIYASNKFVVRAGGRVTHSDYINDFKFSPRLSTAYKFDKNNTLSMSWGWFFQRPYDDYLVYTDQIESERSDHYTLSFQHLKEQRVLRLDLYYKDYKNLVKYNAENLYSVGVYNNEGYGYAGGFDLLWRDKKSLKNAEYWISYSYLDTKRLYRDYTEEVSPYYSSKHNLSVVFKYFFQSIRSLAGFTYRYASPRNYNDPNSTQFYTAKTLPYHTLNLNWTLIYRDNIIFYASATNVLGFKQSFGYRYSDVQNDDGIYDKAPIIPGAKRFFVLGCFVTLSKKGKLNQLDKIE